MKNLHSINHLSDKHWAAARWWSGRKIKIDADGYLHVCKEPLEFEAAYSRYVLDGETWMVLNWSTASWNIVINEWRMSNSKKEFREFILG